MGIANILDQKLNELYSNLSQEQVQKIEEIQAYYQAGIYNMSDWYHRTLAVLEPSPATSADNPSE